ncbi:SH3 domain-containing protein 21 isoform X3 [Oryzias latipes]|uniref:SH3 domain-containing protein 21 isoform X3 n=1 Tax=Oryzias latipes TaxID=8090 RepID=UPI0002A4CB40|nr:SH3 domain-containing protein 21 isoform X3 [Oryzias latipes]
MEVLVLMDFEGTAGDELTVKTGDVLKNVTKANEEGWLHGELRGKWGIFPVNFVKEIPVYLIGDSKREPRSIRKPKKVKQVRKCEVIFPYCPQNDDELELVVGETIEIIREIEDGWWMGVRNAKVGAFPSNFVTEIIFPPKDLKQIEGKSRPKLSDAMFTKEISRKPSVRSHAKTNVEYCQVMFDYKAQSEDELDLKKGDVVVLLRKETEDEGWWEGELNGRCGFFPDNFVMLIPPVSNLQSGISSQPPARNITQEHKAETPVMEKGGPGKMKDEPKDIRSIPPTKVKLPYFNKPAPPPVKDKPNKILPKTNGDAPPVLPKQPEEKEPDQFDGMNVTTEKLSHPTANRAKPPQRRPPSGLTAAAQDEQDSSEKKTETDKLPALIKAVENTLPTPLKRDVPQKSQPPVRPVPLKLIVNSKPEKHHQEPTMESLQAEIKELKMSLDLLQTRHDRDIQEVKEELGEERSKRLALQEELERLKIKF